ncbi:hypothetical protein ABBQ38_005409 [Trebouxia sp. C0009 RCD-2024]
MDIRTQHNIASSCIGTQPKNNHTIDRYSHTAQAIASKSVSIEVQGREPSIKEVQGREPSIEELRGRLPSIEESIWQIAKYRRKYGIKPKRQHIDEWGTQPQSTPAMDA